MMVCMPLLASATAFPWMHLISMNIIAESVPSVDYVCTLSMHNLYMFIYPCFILSDYIDEVFGGESLWPAEPHLKAKARLLVNDFETMVSCIPIKSI